MTTMAVEQRLDIGKVISNTFGVLGRNIAVFGGLTLLLVGLPSLVVTFGVLQMFEPGTAGFTMDADAFAPMFFGGLLSIVTTAMLQGAVIHGTIRDLNGRPASFAECLATGLRHFLPVIGLSILMGLGVALGLILLIVPGIILALMWAVAVPAKVAEGIGVFEAFGRSRELTRNNRLMILVLFIIYAVISWVLTMLLTAVGLGVNPTPGGNVIAQTIGSTIVDVIGSLIIAVATSVIYVEIRRAKEGVDTTALATLFD